MVPVVSGEAFVQLDVSLPCRDTHVTLYRLLALHRTVLDQAQSTIHMYRAFPVCSVHVGGALLLMFEDMEWILVFQYI